MAIDLKKYDGRYVEILYGTEYNLSGKLVGTTLFPCHPFEFDVLGEIIPTQEPPYEINGRNINAIRDMTSELYRRICNYSKQLEDPSKCGFFGSDRWESAVENAKKTKSELEEILKSGK